MLEETIWKTFEITGSIDAYMCYKEIKDVCQSDNNKDVED